jgi:hypothetical protein
MDDPRQQRRDQQSPGSLSEYQQQLNELFEGSDALNSSASQKHPRDGSSDSDEVEYESDFSKRRKLHSTEPDSDDTNARYLIIHRVLCNRTQVYGEDHTDHIKSADYFDVPRLYAGDTRGSLLRGVKRMEDLEEYYENNPDTVFVVYRTYSCTTYHQLVKDDFETRVLGIVDRQVLKRLRPWFYSLSADGPFPSPKSEEVIIASERLRHAIRTVVASNPDRLGEWDEKQNPKAPYDYFFHTEAVLREISRSVLDWSYQDEINVLLDYLEESHGEQFNDARAAFSNGLVSRSTLSKLFGPNEVVVSYKNGDLLAYVCERCPDVSSLPITLKCWAWTFEGSFQKTSHCIRVEWPDVDESVVSIFDLSVWPLRLDQPGARAKLEDRGRKFWAYRQRKLVSYVAPNPTNFELHTVSRAPHTLLVPFIDLTNGQTNPQYMIDFDTYRQLHPEKFKSSGPQNSDISQECMENDEPPKGPFCLLLPATILGYGFHDKKWSKSSCNRPLICRSDR